MARDPNSTTYRLCGAKKKQGIGTCTLVAGQGTSHPGTGRCKWHGGSTESGRKSAAAEEMRKMAPVMGLPIDVHPHDALLACVRISAGEVAYCTGRIEELNADEAVGNPTTVKAKPGVEIDLEGGQVVDFLPELVEEVTYHKVELNIWISARHKALDSLARYSKMALDAGVAERQVQAAESAAQTIATAMQEFMVGLSLSREQQAIAPALMRRVLTTIEEEGSAD